MKKTICILLLTLFISTFMFCQTQSESFPTQKGNFIVGGSSNLTFASTTDKAKSDNDESESVKSFSLSLSPAAGYFIIDNLAVGLQLPVSFLKSDFQYFDGFGLNTANRKTTTIVAAPFVRYYFSGSNIKPFLQGNIGLGSSKSKISEPDSSESKSSIFTYGFDGGIAIVLNNNVSIDLGVGYGSSTSKPKENNSSNLKFINNAFGFNAGFNIFL